MACHLGFCYVVTKRMQFDIQHLGALMLCVYGNLLKIQNVFCLIYTVILPANFARVRERLIVCGDEVVISNKGICKLHPTYMATQRRPVQGLA